MRGKILEWNNDKGDKRIGLLVPDRQVKSLTSQGRGLVYMLDEDFNIKKNEKGGLELGVVTMSKAKCIGFQD